MDNIPHHSTQGLDGPLRWEHVAKWSGKGIAETMRIVGHLVVVILLGVELLELLDCLLIFEALDFA